MSSINVPIVGRVPIGSAPTAGNIVSIILKAKKLKRAIPRAPKETYTPPKYDYLFIPVDAKLQEAYSQQVEVTQFPIENGSVMSDHAIVKPLKIDLLFEVANFRAGILKDAVKGEAGKYALDQWLQQLLLRQTVDLQTTHKLLKNMVCTSIQADNTAPLWGKLAFRASFTQITKVTYQNTVITTDMVQMSSKQTTPPGQKAGSPMQSGLPKKMTQKSPVSLTGVASAAQRYSASSLVKQANQLSQFLGIHL
jgi:hypothetical protein